MRVRLHIIPAGVLDPGDGKPSIDFGDKKTLQRAFEALRDFVALAYAGGQGVGVPILVEHGKGLDGARVGTIVGIELASDGIYAVADLLPQYDERFKSGEWRAVSPAIWWGFAGNDGEMYPAAVLEVSFVSVPRIMLGQTPAEALDLSMLSQLGMTVARGHVTRYSLDLVSSNPPPARGTKMDPAMLEALKGIVAEALAPLLADIEALKAGAAPAAPVAAVVEPVAPVAAPAPTTMGMPAVTAMSQRMAAAPHLAPAAEDIANAYAHSIEGGEAFVSRLLKIGGAPQAVNGMPAPTANGRPVTEFSQSRAGAVAQKAQRTDDQIAARAREIHTAAKGALKWGAALDQARGE